MSEQLLSSVVLGKNVQDLSELIQLKRDDTALMAVTRSQTKTSQANEANLREVSLIHKDTPPPVLTHEKGEDNGKLGELES